MVSKAQVGRAPPGASTVIRIREPLRKGCARRETSTRSLVNFLRDSGLASASRLVCTGEISVDLALASLRWLARSQPDCT